MKLSQPQVLETTKNRENLAQLNTLMEEARVKQFLLDNPNFLGKNPELLSHIELAQQEEDTYSLVERQVKTLREKNSYLQGQQIDMLRMAHANEELLIACNQFMLDLVGCPDLKSFCALVVNRLKSTFELDGAAIVLVGKYISSPAAIVFDNAQQVKELLSCQFPDNQPLCGRLGQSAKNALFGDLSSELQSCVLIPLGDGCKNGLIAVASKDVHRFNPNMGTLFVELIAQYVSAIIMTYEQS